ncbi:hypothetical protein CJF31_00010971 [Rutstroemia sp. NJR-2017a BVV2]|nr:hypothetical protein CJF31_00010971 [Rutstroemia sp. NJR-2017a BVV2]
MRVAANTLRILTSLLLQGEDFGADFEKLWRLLRKSYYIIWTWKSPKPEKPKLSLGSERDIQYITSLKLVIVVASIVMACFLILVDTIVISIVSRWYLQFPEHSENESYDDYKLTFVTIRLSRILQINLILLQISASILAYTNLGDWFFLLTAVIIPYILWNIRTCIRTLWCCYFIKHADNGPCCCWIWCCWNHQWCHHNNFELCSSGKTAR